MAASQLVRPMDATLNVRRYTGARRTRNWVCVMNTIGASSE